MTGPRLEITVLDVGWGDSILIEANDGKKSTFALIDSNDTATYPSSLIFLKRHFERLKYNPFPYPMFEHVFATHAHADHVNGLQSLFRTFGTRNFHYSACDKKKNVTIANTLRWAKRAKRNKIKVAAGSGARGRRCVCRAVVAEADAACNCASNFVDP
jgi:beta-lactamase superfamily II metal-dependent hydrolase